MWGLLLAGIKHFGNDLGFTSEFARALDLLKIENSISNLQLTEPKRDGTSFVQFNNDNAFRIDNLGRKTKVISTQTKLSRINTFNALWLHFGKKTKDYYQSFLDHNKIHTIEMGKLVY